MDIQQPAVLTSMLPPLLFTLCKEIHISFLPLFVHLTLAGVWATAGTILLSPAAFLEGQAEFLPVFPHRITADVPQQARLS